MNTITGEHLEALGAILRRRDERAAIVVVGGSALNMPGVIDRATHDVDVIARAELDDSGPGHVIPPDPLPEILVEAIQKVVQHVLERSS